MSKKSAFIKEGILVTIVSFAAMVLSFMLYYLVFMLFDSIENRAGSYGFVSYIRVGYGFLWIFLCLILYRAKIPDWLKASILAASLTTFMAAIGVQLFKSPIIVGLIMLLVSVIGVLLLYKMKKKWYHYYAIGISVIAAVFYL